jgi:hypothetical protein
MLRARTNTWAILAVTVLLAGRAVAGEMNSLSKEEIADGWILLFDGSTTLGWETVGEAKWKVADGTLVSNEGTGWIVTNTEFPEHGLQC